MEAIMKKLILAVCLVFMVGFGFADRWKFRTSDVKWEEHNNPQKIHIHWEEPVEYGESGFILDASYFALPFSYWYKVNDEIERAIILELFREAMDNPGEVVVYVNQIFDNDKVFYEITSCYVEDYESNKVWITKDYE